MEFGSLWFTVVVVVVVVVVRRLADKLKVPTVDWRPR